MEKYNSFVRCIGENQMEKVDASEEMLLKPTRMNHQAISSCIIGDNTDYRDH